jgi:hypothetical protein
MATPAQIAANCINAQRSTGPRTEEGKSAVSRNSLSHGLSARQFTLLPHEDPAEYAALLEALAADHNPQGATQLFLVKEMAQAQWKLQRIAAIEAELLTSEDSLSNWFKEDCSKDEVLLKLSRYEASARRAWYKALGELRKIRSEEASHAGRRTGMLKAQSEYEFHRSLRQRLAVPASPSPQNCKTKPMPAHLSAELERHKRRDPYFDPANDRSQMSKELRKWFSRAVDERPQAAPLL